MSKYNYDSPDEFIKHMRHYYGYEMFLSSDKNINGIKEALSIPIEIGSTFTRNMIISEYHNTYNKYRNDLSKCEFSCSVDKNHYVQSKAACCSNLIWACCTDCAELKAGQTINVFTFFYLKNYGYENIS